MIIKQKSESGNSGAGVGGGEIRYNSSPQRTDLYVNKVADETTVDYSLAGQEVAMISSKQHAVLTSWPGGSHDKQ